MFEFDNSFSWLKSKSVSYKINVIQTETFGEENAAKIVNSEQWEKRKEEYVRGCLSYVCSLLCLNIMSVRSFSCVIEDLYMLKHHCIYSTEEAFLQDYPISSRLSINSEANVLKKCFFIPGRSWWAERVFHCPLQNF